MVRTANKSARQYVVKRVEFQGNNTFGRWTEHADTKCFVVYSYGEHWPLFVYDDGSDSWYENADSYSRSTSRHQSQLHPRTPTTPVSAHVLKEIAYHGVVRTIARKFAMAA